MMGNGNVTLQNLVKQLLGKLLNLIFAKEKYLINIFSELDLHVANKSYVVITEPDLWQDPHAVLEYQIDDTRAEIEATCTAYGGKPVPEFHW